MVASIVAPYILSMWTAQWPCFRQHVKAACRSTTFEVFQGDFAAVNPTGGGDTTLLYENETAIIFSHCVFSTVGAYFLKTNLLLLLCLQWQGQKHPNSTGATLRWSFVTWMRRCTWRQRAALWSRLGRELVRRCRNTGRSVKTDVWQWGTLRTGAGSPGLCHWLRVFNLKSVETHETHEPRVCVDYRSLN